MQRISSSGAFLLFIFLLITITWFIGICNVIPFQYLLKKQTQRILKIFWRKFLLNLMKAVEGLNSLKGFIVHLNGIWSLRDSCWLCFIFSCPFHGYLFGDKFGDISCSDCGMEASLRHLNVSYFFTPKLKYENFNNKFYSHSIEFNHNLVKK